MCIRDRSTMVDPVPYVASVANTATTEGGAEIESDADLAERVFLAPGAYSTAGPEDSYLYPVSYTHLWPAHWAWNRNSFSAPWPP